MVYSMIMELGDLIVWLIRIVVVGVIAIVVAYFLSRVISLGILKSVREHKEGTDDERSNNKANENKKSI